MFDFTANAVTMAMLADGMALFRPLYWLFGKCMEFLLSALSNEYFIAIIIFTVLTRLIVLPATCTSRKRLLKRQGFSQRSRRSRKNIPIRKTEIS